MIDTPVLNQLILDAFTGKMTWLAASEKHSLEDFLDAFRRARAVMQKTLDGLTDAQAAHVSICNPAWSLSETVTHLIFSQNFYHNQLLDITTSQLPHIVEAAKGFGEGSKRDVQAEVLRQMLRDATSQIDSAIAQTCVNSDPTRITMSPFFGRVSYQTWILLLLAHEVDHVRQAIVMRRMARAAVGG